VVEVVKYWRISATDGLVWIITFLSTVFLDVDIGMRSVGVLHVGKYTPSAPHTTETTFVGKGRGWS
jgi:hypothetical protein